MCLLHETRADVPGYAWDRMYGIHGLTGSRYRKAVRATLILLPLLGLQYVLTPFKPPPGSAGEAIYEIFAAVSTSFQVSYTRPQRRPSIVNHRRCQCLEARVSPVVVGVESRVRPDIESPLMLSLQGFCVSLLFCFCNAEVIAAIRKFYTHKLVRNTSGHRLTTRRNTIKSTVV